MQRTILIVTLLSFSLFLCAGCSDGGSTTPQDEDTEKHASNLPDAVVQSLVSGDVSHAMAFVMDEGRWRRVAKMYEEDLPASISFADLASRSSKSLEGSFDWIREEVNKRGMNWTEAKLKGFKMRSPSQKWVDYSTDCDDVRVDIRIFFTTPTRALVVRADDCFMIDGERFLGDGLKLDLFKERR